MLLKLVRWCLLALLSSTLVFGAMAFKQIHLGDQSISVTNANTQEDPCPDRSNLEAANMEVVRRMIETALNQ